MRIVAILTMFFSLIMMILLATASAFLLKGEEILIQGMRAKVVCIFIIVFTFFSFIVSMAFPKGKYVAQRNLEAVEARYNQARIKLLNASANFTTKHVVKKIVDEVCKDNPLTKEN